MAKKTASNAVKKIDEQIKNLESNQKSRRTSTNTSTTKKTTTTKTTTAKKTTTKKSTSTRDKVVVAPAKKKSTTTKKKTTTSKTVRGGVVTPAKKTTTKTIEKEKIKNDLKEKEKIEVVEARDEVRDKKKELAEEVNKILEIEETNVVEAPKFIQEEKPEVKDTTEDLGSKIKEFLEKEDQKEIENTSNISLDEVDVIKFDTPKNTKKKSNLKKRYNDKEYYDKLKLEKPIDIDQIDKIEEYNIVEDFKKDIPSKTEFTRKRKGKGYVVERKKKPTYNDLENDLRDLYDKVGEVVDDFDNTATIPVIEKPKEVTKKKFTLFGAKKKDVKKTEVVAKKPVVKPVKKTKVIEENVTVDTDRGERPSLLDHISQRVLNFFLTVLFIIFFLMVIAFIGFIIYVSTF